MSFGIEIKDHDGCPLLQLSGRVRGEGDDKLQETLESMLEKPGDKVIVDLTTADYIDSHGLGVIIYYHKVLQNHDRKLVLLNGSNDPESYISRLIEITNLDKVLKVADTLEEAAG